ncbi:hypothetical protein R5R35_002442 [Gryllus longicercus]|uniref:Alpha-mannosidase n=1 Tax=Gryllus longicercus TaxID=2509291 RepID=A0AAN9V561_9ORTH
MRIRKLSALLGAGVILMACVVLYLMMDLMPFPDFQENKWIHVDNKFKQTKETDAETVGTKPASKPIDHSFLSEHTSLKTHTVSQNVFDSFNFNVSCSLQISEVPESSVQLLDVYKLLKFDNPDGGAWKQGWNVEYYSDQWNKNNKLKVFVVPHSHNDPGWIKTFEDYYHAQTRNILTNMVKKLSEDQRRKFIWAEISYLSLFWDEIDASTKEQLKALLESGQLEIVTGGWVMNDEANAHYFAILQQIIEGHQWLANHLDYIPRNSWAIDPFGHSPIMPYFLKRMGLENLVVQRVHYSMKKYLSRTKNLEFNWRQLWDGSGTTDLFTQVMPFYSYDIPHTCGPDPKVCCQFDFRRLPGFGISCPWKVPPQVINERNVKDRAEKLLDQYRKKAQLYRTNVLLVPLGDDFRYDQANEWDAQYNNYQKLFDYMNKSPDLYVEAQFGTLHDYFSAVHSELPAEKFPTISGDFFTYADRDDHYWSGYFTSRPFYKRMDRILINYLRCAEILYGFAWGSKKDSIGSEWLIASESGFSKLLSEARRSLSLFQHHDAITGTAKDHVVEDYARKMLEAIKLSQHIMQQAAHFLLSSNSQGSYQPDPEAVYFDLDDQRKQHHSLPEKITITIAEGVEPKKVVIFNSLTWTRQEMVTIQINTPYVKVTTSNGNPVNSQTSPVFQRTGGMRDSTYQVSFVVNVEPLSLTTYLVHPSPTSGQTDSNSLSKVQIYNVAGQLPLSQGFEDVEMAKEGKEFSLSNGVFKAHFSKSGFLKALSLKYGEISTVVPVHIDFARYKARDTKETSGAYLFLPSGPAVGFLDNPTLIRVMDGPLFAQVDVVLHNVQHSVKIYKTPGADSLGLEIENLVDISNEVNYELVMRVTSQVSNGDEFFTDLNGLQMIRRKRFSKLPIQANYYPMPTAAFIEDSDKRLTILSAEPVGFGSLKEGQLEVMQDRRLNQDDNRGLFQGVLDNHPTKTVFRLLLERREANCQGVNEKHPSGLLSRYAHLSSLSMLNPLMRLLPTDIQQGKLNLHFTPVTKGLGHDMHLVKLHTLFTSTSVKAGVILQRIPTDPCLPIESVEFTPSNGQVNMSSLFPLHFSDTVTPTSLSFLHSGKAMNKGQIYQICPMEMTAYLLSR